MVGFKVMTDVCDDEQPPKNLSISQDLGDMYCCYLAYSI